MTFCITLVADSGAIQCNNFLWVDVYRRQNILQISNKLGYNTDFWLEIYSVAT